MTNPQQVDSAKASISAYISAGVSFLVVMVGVWVIFTLSMFFIADEFSALPLWTRTTIPWGVTIGSVVLGSLSAYRSFQLAKHKEVPRGESRQGQSLRWWQRTTLLQILGTSGGLLLGLLIGYFSTHDRSFGAMVGGFLGFVCGFFGSALFVTFLRGTRLPSNRNE